MTGRSTNTLVAVTASDTEVVNGRKFGFGPCGPGYAGNCKPVKPTTVEEYSLLRYLGHYLGVTNMPDTVLPAQRSGRPDQTLRYQAGGRCASLGNPIFSSGIRWKSVFQAGELMDSSNWPTPASAPAGNRGRGQTIAGAQAPKAPVKQRWSRRDGLGRVPNLTD